MCKSVTFHTTSTAKYTINTHIFLLKNIFLFKEILKYAWRCNIPWIMMRVLCVLHHKNWPQWGVSLCFKGAGTAYCVPPLLTDFCVINRAKWWHAAYLLIYGLTVLCVFNEWTSENGINQMRANEEQLSYEWTKGGLFYSNFRMCFHCLYFYIVLYKGFYQLWSIRFLITDTITTYQHLKGKKGDLLAIINAREKKYPEATFAIIHCQENYASFLIGLRPQPSVNYLVVSLKATSWLHKDWQHFCWDVHQQGILHEMSSPQPDWRRFSVFWLMQ